MKTRTVVGWKAWVGAARLRAEVEVGSVNEKRVGMVETANRNQWMRFKGCKSDCAQRTIIRLGRCHTNR